MCIFQHKQLCILCVLTIIDAKFQPFVCVYVPFMWHWRGGPQLFRISLIYWYPVHLGKKYLVSLLDILGGGWGRWNKSVGGGSCQVKLQRFWKSTNMVRILKALQTQADTRRDTYIAWVQGHKDIITVFFWFFFDINNACPPLLYDAPMIRRSSS